jgi:hypothetical protein
MFRAGLWCVVALMVGGCLEATTKSVRETLPTTVGLTEQKIFERYGFSYSSHRTAGSLSMC